MLYGSEECRSGRSTSSWPASPFDWLRVTLLLDQHRVGESRAVGAGVRNDSHGIDACVRGARERGRRHGEPPYPVQNEIRQIGDLFYEVSAQGAGASGVLYTRAQRGSGRA
jgi:hypothetical protein